MPKGKITIIKKECRMKLKVFSIYDLKAQLYSSPSFMSTRAQAIRAFIDEAKKPDSKVALHPEDYRLYYIGTYEDETGTLCPEKENEDLGLAQHLISEK